MQARKVGGIAQDITHVLADACDGANCLGGGVDSCVNQALECTSRVRRRLCIHDVTAPMNSASDMTCSSCLHSRSLRLHVNVTADSVRPDMDVDKSDCAPRKRGAHPKFHCN